MWAMVVKEFQELRRDRRTMAMLVVLPLLLLVVFGYAANFTITSIPTDVYGPQAQQVAGALTAPFEARTVDPGGNREDAETALRDNKVDVGIVTQSSGTPTALIVSPRGQITLPKPVRARLRLGDVGVSRSLQQLLEFGLVALQPLTRRDHVRLRSLAL
jgi:ABC-2 type transport system permease protein